MLLIHSTSPVSKQKVFRLSIVGLSKSAVIPRNGYLSGCQTVVTPRKDHKTARDLNELQSFQTLGILFSS